jgi:hypothetical protein
MSLFKHPKGGAFLRFSLPMYCKKWLRRLPKDYIRIVEIRKACRELKILRRKHIRGIHCEEANNAKACLEVQ